MKNHFLISDQEEKRIRRLHESYKTNPGTGKLIKEQQQDTELYVYDKDKVMVGTMDYKNRPSGYKKFIPNEEGTKRGYKSGDDIPEGTRTLKPGIKP